MRESARDDRSFVGRLGPLFCSACIVLAAGTSAWGADWPTHQGNNARTGITLERIRFPLSPVWVRESAAPPSPAWPDAAGEYSRIDYDSAPQPVVAKGIVYVGSNTDDTLRAIEAASGEIKWEFTAGGPIRFAPAVADGRVYLVSDGGRLYCLNAATGALVWKFQGGLGEERMIGSGRLISRWPFRSGVAVEGGVVYTIAGMWPADGIYVYALDARTGREIWVNDITGFLHFNDPNGRNMAGVAPQGCLALSSKEIVVPTGRLAPAVFDRGTGGLLHYNWRSKQRTHLNRQSGGVRAAVYEKKGVYVSYSGHITNRRSNITATSRFRLDTGAYMGSQKYIYMLMTDKNTYDISIGRDKISRLSRQGGWRVPVSPDVHSFVMCGNALITLGKGLCAYDPSDGKVLWSDKDVDGLVRGIAISDGRVVASTVKGTIYCYGPQGKSARRAVKGAAPREVRTKPTPLADRVLTKLKESNVHKGYALVFGPSSVGLAETLARNTALRAIAVVPDGDKAAVERRRLLENTSIYGSRLVVQDRIDPAMLPPYFANVVLVTGSPEGLSGKELYRILRPCGGIMMFPGTPAGAVAAILKDAEIPQEEIKTWKGMQIVQRGKLDKAFDWDSKVAADQRVKWPLRLSWFGTVGTGRSFKTGPVPVAANGRFFMVGSGYITAVDAYNGTVLWWKKPRKGKLRSLSANDEAVFLNFGDYCYECDAASGTITKVYTNATNHDVSQNLQESDAGETRGDFLKLVRLDALPQIAKGWGRRPSRGRRGAGVFGNARDKSGRVVNAVTFQQKGELYKKTPDCSKGGGSAYMDVFRFSNVGMYDHIDNAGIRVFGGMRPSCRDSAVVAALGMLGINGNTAPCTCNYSFQTFVGLAPVERPRNEDWTIYYDAFPKGAVRRMAINLAAPGDHLGGAGEMWLGFPRPMFQYAMRLPIWVERMGQFGTYVFNSDRTPIEGTDRPWVYTSGVRGFQKATVLLELPGGFTSVKCSTPPTIDGVIDEDCWRPVSGTGVEGRNSLFVCHDDKNFYIAIRRHSEVGPRGLKPWNKGAAGRDAPVWENGTYSSFEFYMGRFALKFKNTAWRNVGIHLGLSASGALYDASWECNSERRGVTEDPNWDGEWTYKVRTDKDAFVAELSVPWDSLTTAGISRDAPLQILADSLKRRGPLRGKRPILGSWGHPADRKTFVLAFAEPELPRPVRKYTVRLHFAEVDEVEPGRRVFDIKLQGKIVRRGFDIIGETGARHKALVKQFEDIEASDRVTVEFVPRVEALSKETVPLLSGLEVIEQR